jgi:hypothetical protein
LLITRSFEFAIVTSPTCHPHGFGGGVGAALAEGDGTGALVVPEAGGVCVGVGVRVESPLSPAAVA